MNIKTILASKGNKVLTVSGEQTLLEISNKLASENVGALVVASDDNQILGIISERDIVRLLGQKGVDVLSDKVANHMVKNVLTCTEVTTIDQAMELMTNKRCRHLPVEADGSLIGVISIGDVVKKKIEAAEQEAEEMRSYIVTV